MNAQSLDEQLADYISSASVLSDSPNITTRQEPQQQKDKQTMKLQNPFIITPRLMAGLRIGGAFISMGQGERNSEGRTQYGVYIDLPDGSEHEVTDLRSGCQGGSLQDGFASLLSFLGAAAESYNYKGEQGENAHLFQLPVTRWAADNADEISMLNLEIEENPELITAD